MALYKMVRGRYARMERGVRVNYDIGDPIELTDDEAVRLVALVEKVGSSSAKQEQMRAAIPPSARESTFRVGDGYQPDPHYARGTRRAPPQGGSGTVKGKDRE